VFNSSSYQAHEIQVTSAGPAPYPKTVRINDVVAWTFPEPKHNDLQAVKTLGDAQRALTGNSVEFEPRLVNNSNLLRE